MPTYHLAEHVFFCHARRQVIFLDLKRDKYLSIPNAEMDGLGQFLHGWSPDDRALHPTAITPSAGIERLASDLIACGMLLREAGNTKDALPTTQPAPTRTIQGDDLEGRPITAREAIWFLWHAARTSLEVRYKPLDRIIEALARHKQRARGRGAQFDFSIAARTIWVFNATRPLYPRRYLCLYDALVLLQMLNSRGQYPTFVFGVSEDPFGAHCWLQQGSVALNDNLERVNAYIPIMAT